MLEMVFPYMCIDEFNSVFDVEPMYIQEISAGATIAQYLIAMTDNFRVFYLMPVPDFFLTEESAAEPLGPENEEVAEFQSVSRLAGTYCVADKRSILLGDESTTVTIIDDPAFNGKLINGKIWVSLEFDSDLETGTNAYLVSLTPDAQTGLAPTLSTDHMTSLLVSDFNTNSYTSFGEFCWSSFSFDTVKLNIQAIGNANDRDAHFAYVIHFSPFGEAVTLTNANNQDAEGFVAIENTIPIVVTPSGTVDVFVTNTGADAVPVTNEDSSPLFVTVENDFEHPVPISQTDLLAVIVSNDASDPVPVSFSSEDPIAVVGRVQGVANPDTPVFISSYFTP